MCVEPNPNLWPKIMKIIADENFYTRGEVCSFLQKPNSIWDGSTALYTDSMR